MSKSIEAEVRAIVDKAIRQSGDYVLPDSREAIADEAVAPLMRLMEPPDTRVVEMRDVDSPRKSADTTFPLPPETGVALERQIVAMKEAIEYSDGFWDGALEAALATLRWVQGLTGKESK